MVIKVSNALVTLFAVFGTCIDAESANVTEIREIFSDFGTFLLDTHVQLYRYYFIFWVDYGG